VTGPVPLQRSAAGPQHDAGLRPDSADPTAWVRAVADELTAAGLTARVDDPGIVHAVAVTASMPSRGEADVIIDEDGCAELRWWPGPGTAPAEVASTIVRALAAVRTPRSDGGCSRPRHPRRG
jgi:hypothetical protein